MLYHLCEALKLFNIMEKIKYFLLAIGVIVAIYQFALLVILLIKRNNKKTAEQEKRRKEFIESSKDNFDPLINYLILLPQSNYSEKDSNRVHEIRKLLKDMLERIEQIEKGEFSKDAISNLNYQAIEISNHFDPTIQQFILLFEYKTLTVQQEKLREEMFDIIFSGLPEKLKQNLDFQNSISEMTETAINFLENAKREPLLKKHSEFRLRVKKIKEIIKRLNIQCLNNFNDRLCNLEPK